MLFFMEERMPAPYSLDLWRKFGELCDIFSPKECLNYFKNAGYGKKLELQTNS